MVLKATLSALSLGVRRKSALNLHASRCRTNASKVEMSTPACLKTGRSPSGVQKGLSVALTATGAPLT